MRKSRKLLALMIVLAMVIGGFGFLSLDSKPAKLQEIDFTKWVFIDSSSLLYQLAADGENLPANDEERAQYFGGYFSGDNAPTVIFGWEGFDLEEKDENFAQIPDDVTDIIVSDRMVVMTFDENAQDAMNKTEQRTRGLLEALKEEFPEVRIHMLASLPLASDNPRIHYVGDDVWVRDEAYPNLHQIFVDWGWLRTKDNVKCNFGSDMQTYNEEYLEPLCDELGVHYVEEALVPELLDENNELKPEYSSDKSWGYHLNEEGIEIFGDAIVEAIKNYVEEEPDNNDDEDNDDEDNDDDDNDDEDNDDDDNDDEDNDDDDNDDDDNDDDDNDDDDNDDDDNDDDDNDDDDNDDEDPDKIPQTGQNNIIPYIFGIMGILLAVAFVYITSRKKRTV